MLELSTPVKYVKRIGERIGEHLATRGIHTVEDLLYHLPFRYEDRLNPQPISALTPGGMASIIGEVRGSVLLRTRSGSMFEMTLGQGSASVKCIWFHGSYLKDKFKPGQMVAVYGKLESSRTFKAAESSGSLPPALSKFKIIQPQFEILPSGGDPDAEFAMLEMGRIVPVYESLGGTTAWGAKLTSRWMRRILWSILQELTDVPETLPTPMLDRLGFPARLAALRAAHFPEAGTPMPELMSAASPAHRRLIFEELFYLELGLSLKRRKMRERAGTAFTTGPAVRDALKQVLPFHPTAAQKRVLAEIVADMRRPQPMRRLLQGDVGSGKTIVAMQAALVAIENGYQVALMAPTEILATQHYLSARKLLADAVSPSTTKPYRVTLLTGSLEPALKRETQGGIMRGEVQLVIGTHALQEEKADFANLGLVIVDEQHRFGVQQRFRLMRKPGADGRVTDPDVLAMTATPIPRTLALTLYGDLDVSVIDEMPPGRTPIVTRRTAEDRADDVWAFVRKQASLGRQTYLVYPVIEGSRDDQPELDFAHDPEEAPEDPAPKRSAKKAATKSIRAKTQRLTEKPKLRAAADMYDELRHGALAGLRLGLLHGRQSADEKEVTMARFKRGEIDVLVSTTVIEVGVDVPNATVMVIDHAERFGLAQMHQLRGRVGRGAAKSYCILMTGNRVTEQAEARLNAMVATQNGFELAELDLQQRGPGEFFGTRQTGLPEFRVANLLRDRALLELAKTEAERFSAAPDPALARTDIDAVWERLKQQWQRRYGLVEA